MKKGYHTPELTTSILNTLEEIGVKCQDVSWSNDLTDSIWLPEFHVIVYLPNHEEYNPDEERFNTYTVIHCDEEGCSTSGEPLYEGDSIGEVIGKLRKKDGLYLKHEREIEEFIIKMENKLDTEDLTEGQYRCIEGVIERKKQALMEGRVF